jgi:hypothetical protein
MAQDKKNTGSSTDNAIALLCLIACFGVLVTASIFTVEHPIDFIAGFLARLVGFIFLVVFVLSVAGIIIHYINIGYDDPEKSFTERANENYEISREKSFELSNGIRKFYADYKERVRLAEDDSPGQDSKDT